MVLHYILAYNLSQLFLRVLLNWYIQELDPSKACGPDGIPTKLLRETSFAISPVLTFTTNASLVQESLIPSDWKQPFVIPVHKQAHELIHPITARLISLTCIC